MVCRKSDIRQILRHSTRKLCNWALYGRLDELDSWWGSEYYKYSQRYPKTNSSKKCWKNFEILNNYKYFPGYEKQTGFSNYEKMDKFFQKTWKITSFSKAWKITSFSKVMRNRQVSQIYEKKNQKCLLKKWWKSQVCFQRHGKNHKYWANQHFSKLGVWKEDSQMIKYLGKYLWSFSENTWTIWRLIRK